jgi:hypothetical protein
VENTWSPIESNEVVLAGNKYSPGVTYRDCIETKAGESRNNIVRIDTGGKEISKLNLYTTNIPSGIEVKRGIQWQGPGTIAQVLVIEIAQDIQPAKYTFEIGVEINGTDCGTVPCTIEVSSINKIIIQPEPGSYLSAPDNELSGVVLKDVQVKTGICDKDYFSPWFPSPKKGEPCLAVSGHVQNRDKEKFNIGMTALGYDEAGEVVAGTLDAAHIAGAIGLYLEYEEIGEFTMHLNVSDNISTIRIFAQGALVPLP